MGLRRDSPREEVLTDAFHAAERTISAMANEIARLNAERPDWQWPWPCHRHGHIYEWDRRGCVFCGDPGEDDYVIFQGYTSSHPVRSSLQTC